MTQLRVSEPGLSTTAQDLGRVGGLRFGAPPGGALDRDSHRLANALVGAPLGRSAFELRLTGPTFEVADGVARVAIAGAEVDAVVARADGRTERIGAWRSVTLEPGDALSVGALRGSSTATMAVDPEPVLDRVFGSAATYARGGFGGFRGRPLAGGDVVDLVDAPLAASQDVRVPAPVPPDGPPIVRLVAGPQDSRFDERAFQSLVETEWRVGPAADRMGVRLVGPPLQFAPGARADIVSDGIATGSIQVAADGAPMLLLADRQTTGGYAKIAGAISADMPALGRLSPGDPVRFAIVDPEAGAQAARAAEAALSERIAAIAPHAPEGAALVERLLSENLVTARVEPDA